MLLVYRKPLVIWGMVRKNVLMKEDRRIYWPERFVKTTIMLIQLCGTVGLERSSIRIWAVSLFFLSSKLNPACAGRMCTVCSEREISESSSSSSRVRCVRFHANTLQEDLNLISSHQL